MKSFIITLFASCLTLLGANPSFDSFDTNYFRLVLGPHGPTSIQLQTNLFGNGTNTYIFYSITNVYMVSSNVDAGNIQGTDSRLSRFVGSGSSLSNSIAYETNGQLVVDGNFGPRGEGFTTAGWYGTTNNNNGFVNIRSFNAAGDGLTDDTASIQSAVDQSSMILLPPGNYVITSTITISNRLGFRMEGAADGKSTIIAGSPFSGPMFKFVNCENPFLAGITFDANSKAENGVLFETIPGSGQPPSDGGLIYACQIRGAINGYGLALSIDPLSSPNPQVNNFLIQQSKFYSSKTNVLQLSSNSLRNRFVNCSFSDFLGATDWHIYADRGEIIDDGNEFLQAKEYDIYRGVGAFFHSRNHYSESQRGLYSEVHDPNTYPIEIIGWHQNVLNTTNSVMVFNQNGPVQLDSCLFGGDVYFSPNIIAPGNPIYQTVTVNNCKFFTGGFIGPGVTNITDLTTRQVSLVAPVYITEGTDHLFEFRRTGFFMGLNEAFYESDPETFILQNKGLSWRFYNSRDSINCFNILTNGDLAISGAISLPGRYSIYTNATSVINQNEDGLQWLWYDFLHGENSMTLTNGSLIIPRTLSFSGNASFYTNATSLVFQNTGEKEWTWYDLDHTANAMVLTNGQLTVYGNLVAGYVKPSNMTVSTVPQTDGTGNLVSIANAAGLLANDGSGGMSYVGKTSAGVVLSAGSGTGPYTLGGTLKVDSATHGNGADVTEDDLGSYTLPASSLAVDGDYLEVDLYGTFANNGNTKTLKAYVFGTLVVQDGPSVMTLVIWHIRMKIVRTGATAVSVFSEFTASGSAPNINIANVTATLSNAQIIKCTGESGSSGANDVVEQLAIIKWYKGQ